MSEIETLVHADYSERKFTIERRQDVEAIIENNKRLQTETQRSDWGRHIATIPNIFLEKWLREAWDRGDVDMRLFSPEFDKLCEAKLKDPDWKFLRTDSVSAQTGWSA
jgi:hypothetical protein